MSVCARVCIQPHTLKFTYTHKAQCKSMKTCFDPTANWGYIHECVHIKYSSYSLKIVFFFYDFPDVQWIVSLPIQLITINNVTFSSFPLGVSLLYNLTNICKILTYLYIIIYFFIHVACSGDIAQVYSHRLWKQQSSSHT